MSTPYFRFYPTDFEADTSHLTLIEDGAYNRLLRLCWMTPGCSLPDDEAWILRRCRAHSPEEQQAIRTVLSEFFRVENQRVFNNRLSREFDSTSHRREMAVENGKKGGRPKDPLKTKEKAKPDGLNPVKLKKANQNQNQNQNHIDRDTNVSLVHSFADFWKVWPNKVAKASAEKAWKKLRPDDRQAATEAAVAWFASWQKNHADASPIHPATYLNQRRWGDLERVAAVDNSEIWAKAIRGGQGWAVKGLTPEQCRKLVAAGLVTSEQIRAVGLTQ